MRQAIRFKLIGIAAAAVLFAGCASQAPKQEYSGFLNDYSNLQPVPDSQMGTLLRWASPKATPANYSGVMIPEVQFYPRSEPTAHVSQATLDGIRNYTTEAVRRAAATKTRVVSAPGKGIAKVQLAITGVASEKSGLAAYQYVPIAFVVTMAKRGVEGTPEDAKLVVEGLVTDSVTGEVIGKVVRVGTGKELAKATGSGEREVTVNDVKPLVDAWADDLTKNFGKFFGPK